MNDFKTVLVALSDANCDCGRLNLLRLMKRALRTEAKMAKGVQIEVEQKRYGIFCDRIEFYTQQLLADGKVESYDLGSEYLDLVSKLQSKFPDVVKEIRLSASFCPKELVGSHLSQFENLVRKAGLIDRVDVQKKLAFYQKAKDDGLNVVELLQAWIMTTGEEVAVVIDAEKLKESFLALEISDSVTESKGGGQYVELRNQIEKVVEETKNNISGAVNFSALRHDVIVEVLHEFVYKGGRPMYLPVIYADGSEADPFPLFCLKMRSEQALQSLRGLPVLNVGMMSARHSNDGLDVVVKTYWFRNQEISIGRTQSETDKVAYQKSKEKFLKLRSEGSYRIAFYQTGFQPAVVGFYRALAEELIFREKMPASLEVVPYYYMGPVKGYIVGKVWK